MQNALWLEIQKATYYVANDGTQYDILRHLLLGPARPRESSRETAEKSPQRRRGHRSDVLDEGNGDPHRWHEASSRAADRDHGDLRWDPGTLGMNTPYDDLRCGPLVRKADGTWWYDDVPLGTDSAPLVTCDVLGDRLSLVCVRLFLALGQATERLQNLGHPHPASEHVLAQYLHWRTTGKWAQLPQEIKPALRELECRDLLCSGSTILEQALTWLMGNDAMRLITDAERWIERASLYVEDDPRS